MQHIATMQLSEWSTTEEQLSLAVRQPVRVTDLLDSIESIVLEARAMYPNQQVPDETAVVLQGSFVRLAEEYGLRIFREAIWAHCKASPFFPSVSDMNRRCQEARDAIADIKDAMWHKCGECSNGWVVGPRGAVR